MRKRILSFFAGMACFFSFSSVQAQYDEEFDDNGYESPCCEDAYNGVRGKIDLAPAFAHIDVLYKGRTMHKMDLGGVKGDIYYRVWSGLVLKPSLLYARGEKEDRVLTGGIGVGFCMPFKQCFCFTPVVGINWGELRTKVEYHIAFPNPQTGLFEGATIHLKQKFHSSSPYVGFEFSYTFIPCWRLVGNYQYSWSRTRTFIQGQGTTKDNSKGSSYSAMIEYDITKKWSVNFGGMYNCSLSKEKHGLRAYGFKLGLAYWF